MRIPRVVRVYIICIASYYVGMWRLYRCVIYSNSFWAAVSEFSQNRIAQLLPYLSRISANSSLASHYKCKSVTFSFSLRHFHFACLFCSCLFHGFNHDEPQLMIASNEVCVLNYYCLLVTMSHPVGSFS